MNEKEITPIKNPSEIPEGMTDQDSAEFWDNHELTEDFLLNTSSLAEDEMPPKRTDAKTITIRMDVDIFERLQELADRKHKGYQTLMKQFVIERLYEEEKRMNVR